MKFTRKKETKPEIVDIKEVINFAHFPVRINKETVIWWEKYIIVYRYDRHLCAEPLAIGIYGIWLD